MKTSIITHLRQSVPERSGVRPTSVPVIVITLVFFCFFPCYSLAETTEPTEPEDIYDSVEQRRLHVRIIEAHDEINNERAILELKKKELQKLEKEIDRKLVKLDEKLDELIRQKAEIASMRSGKEESSHTPLKNLSRIYEQMEPLNAAMIITGLEPESAAAILAGMKSRSAARILDLIDRDRAAALTTIIATRHR